MLGLLQNAARKAKRRKLLQGIEEGPLKQYLDTPLPNPGVDIHAVPVLSLDFETSGLDPEEDHLVSAGYVVMHNGVIDLSTATHVLIRSDRSLNEQSVFIHGITDDDVLAGDELEEAIGGILENLAGKILLAHNAKIETTFLKKACRQLYGIEPDFPAIDTMRIARQWFQRRDREIKQGDLRLFNLRKRYHLPSYQAHNALSDAISTAELFMAQIEHMDARGKLPLKHFMG
jgi:DNA polymerase-3 subunit epsilon